MVNYQEPKVKLTNMQLNKINLQQKNKAGAIFRLNKKEVEDEELSHELFLTTRQITKMRNTLANNMSVDIKLSKAQIFKKVQSGGYLGSWLATLSTKALMNVVIPLGRDNLPRLINN